MKQYNFEDFKPNDYAYKLMEDSGRIDSYTGKYSINYSGILTRLIQEAGRFCEHYASDLFIDWQTVMECIDSADVIHNVFLFGFRQYGVDGNSYILSRYNSNGSKARYNYRSLWRLDIDADGKEITMKLGRVF